MIEWSLTFRFKLNLIIYTKLTTFYKHYRLILIFTGKIYLSFKKNILSYSQIYNETIVDGGEKRGQLKNKSQYKTTTRINYAYSAYYNSRKNVKGWDRINSSNLECYQFTRLFPAALSMHSLISVSPRWTVLYWKR